MTEHQRLVVVISQHIRNNLENFHGGMDGGEGFLDDAMMMRLNVCVRYSVDEIVKAIMNPKVVITEVGKVVLTGQDYIDFSLQTFHSEYMELPDSPRLRKAYEELVLGYNGGKA